MISCTTYFNQNIKDAVIKKNSHAIAIERLWLLKKVGLVFSIFFVSCALKTISILEAYIIIAMQYIWYSFNDQQKKYAELISIILSTKKNSEADNASLAVKYDSLSLNIFL